MARKHKKVEHQVGKGQWVIRDATEVRPSVEGAFSETRKELQRSNSGLYERLHRERERRAG